MGLNAALDDANGQVSQLTSDKRSRLIAEEQYRAALLERDRTIKRQQLESEELTARLADSSKLSDVQRSDKRSANEEIERMKGILKKSRGETEEMEVVSKRLREKL